MRARAERRKKPEGPIDAATWERVALEAIREGGLAAVSVEALARKLGVTKGSFYWHFKNRGALLAAALERWERRMDRFLAQLEEIDDPHRRMAEMFFDAAEKAHESLYTTLSASSDHAAVHATIRRVSEKQLQVAVQALRQLGMSPRKAQVRASLAYSLYVGVLHLARNERERLPPPEGLRGYAAEAVEMILRF
jgi:AcrR family transcriptional regulator